MRLIVVGAGIAGSSLTYAARELGHTVTLVDAAPEAAASRLAHAVLRLGWHRGDDRVRARLARERYASLGALRTETALCTHWRTDRTVRTEDYALIDPLAPLIAPDRRATARRIADGCVELADYTLVGDVAVDATGTGGADRLSYGAVATRELELDEPLTVHHYAPRRSIVLSAIDGRARLGGSTGATARSAALSLQRMLAIAERVGMIESADGWDVSVGVRGHRSNPIERLDARTYRLAGFGRVGYALAPAVALELLIELGGVR
jgi:NADPH-dependent 2,4-dienoyl-CoA reductase/sulfur reductase-like enzyme